MITVDLDGGELPQGDFVELAHVPLVVYHVSKLLTDFAKLHKPEDNRAYSYAIKTSATFKYTLERILEDIKLPIGCEYFVIDGRRVFELRGQSGGVTTAVVFYLMVK